MVKNLTIKDLQPMALGYEEGQYVTPKLLKQVERVYQFYHDKYLSVKDKLFHDEELSFALIAHDVSLEFFVNQVRVMVRDGRTDSSDIFRYFLEYIDSYNKLRDVLERQFN